MEDGTTAGAEGREGAQRSVRGKVQSPGLDGCVDSWGEGQGEV